VQRHIAEQHIAQWMASGDAESAEAAHEKHKDTDN
jgi:hypothetical protein